MSPMRTDPGDDTTFEEKRTWICAVVTVVSFGAYLTIVLWRGRSAPLADVAYVGPMLWTIGGGIVASILGNFAVAAAWAKDCGKKDQRDREIHRFGEYVGQSFLIIGGIAALILSMAELAERIGVTRQTIIAIEQGRYSPSLEMGLSDRPRARSSARQGVPVLGLGRRKRAMMRDSSRSDRHRPSAFTGTHPEKVGLPETREGTS